MASGTRRYGGLAAEDRVAGRRARFIDAGLTVIGRGGIASLTVRGVSEEAGLAARYFYESFASVDDLALAVFDSLAAEALTRSLAALAAAPEGSDDAAREGRTRAVLAEMVDLLLEDPRKGRTLMIEAGSSPALSGRVRAEVLRFAGMVAATATVGNPTADPALLPADVRLVAQFLIGGMSAAVATVLQGDIDVDRERLTDTLVNLFGAVDRGSRLAGRH